MFHKKLITCLVMCSSIIILADSVEKEMTINVDPGKEDCFYQSAKQGDAIDIEYQVIDGGHGDLDISFHLADPTGRILVSEFKKSENNHRIDVQRTGDYKLCFDNTFSTYNMKTVFFELIVEAAEDNEWGGSDENNYNFQGINLEEVYEIKVQDVQEIVNSVRNSLTKIQHLQGLIKSAEARDRNIAEEMYFRVNTYSLFTLVVICLVGFVQIIMVKSLFDDRSKVHKIWKHLHM